MRFTLWVRKKIEVNTDPQRRCYDGCHFSSELVWTKWEGLLDYDSREAAQDTADTFHRINPTREYKVTLKGERP